VKSKLLQKISHSQAHQSDELFDDQQDPSAPWRDRENPLGRVNPATGTQARKDFPRLLKHGCRSATS
jgi:hypothetical protein